MVLSRRITWIILLGTILTAGLLRQFHERIPSSPFLPWPIRSLLFFNVLILVLVFARGWGKRQQIPYAGPGLKHVNFLAFLPLLIGIMLEKWVSITFYDPLFDLVNRQTIAPAKFDALYVLHSASGLMIVTLLLIPLFRRLIPLLKRYLDPARIPVAVAGIGIPLLVLYGGLWLICEMLAAPGVHLRLAGYGTLTGLILAGQGLIAFAEEFYYRGLLQTELAFLMPSLGVSGRRIRRVAALALISLAFAMEHLAPTGHIAVDLRRFLFAFGCALFLGTLLVLLDNLWLNAGCHLMLNLFALGTDPSTAGGGLQFVDALGRPVFEPAIYIFLFFVLVFIFAYVRIAMTPYMTSAQPAHRAAASR